VRRLIDKPEKTDSTDVVLGKNPEKPEKIRKELFATQKY
jgi:hypothetical protein